MQQASENRETLSKVIASKSYILNRVSDVLTYHNRRNARKGQALREGMDEAQFFKQESDELRRTRQRTRISDHILLGKLGAGSWGEVYLARHADGKELMALKKMNKDVIFQKNQLKHIQTERSVLIDTSLSHAEARHLIQLNYSFQDEDSLYLAMEYCCGGDFQTLLSNIGVLDHECARFYIAEMLLCVGALHTLGYIHRDLKPDNFLITREGRLKLGDFGLSKKAATMLASQYSDQHEPQNPPKTQFNSLLFSPEEAKQFQAALREEDARLHKRAMAFSTVGSPDYMAPEVLDGAGYSFEADFWSLGCILFEMYTGFPPFHGASPSDCFDNVKNWQTSLQYPMSSDMEMPIPEVAWDLIKKLLCGCSKRVGRNGVDEIKQHPYFEGIDWDKDLLDLEPPFEPELMSDDDTSYFTEFEKIYPDSLVTLEPFIASQKEEEKMDTECIESLSGIVLEGSQISNPPKSEVSPSTPSMKKIYQFTFKGPSFKAMYETQCLKENDTF